jgi:S-adenosylmethionine:tRNA ribosyltransferase-isomerase
MALTLADFDFDLPDDRIARFPAERRDDSRLLVLDRTTGTRTHARFADLPRFLAPHDLLVVNDARVLPAPPARQEARHRR